MRRLLERLGVPDEPAVEIGPAPAGPRAAASVARDVVVLLADPDRDHLASSGWAGYMVAGALLVELSSEGRLAVEDTGKRTRVSVADPTPPRRPRARRRAGRARHE